MDATTPRLDLLANPGWNVAAGSNLNCFLLSDGNLNWGETDIAPLVARHRSLLLCLGPRLGPDPAFAVGVAASARARLQQCLRYC